MDKDEDKKSLSFPKSLRLLNAKDYSSVFDDAPIRAAHPQVLILSRLNSHSTPRLGLIVAKKNLRLAVSRNRFKRCVRESFRLKQHQLPEIDAIVLARRGADKLTGDDLSQILNGLWKRIAKQAAKHSAQINKSE